MAKNFCIVLPFFLAFCALSHGISVLNETINCRSQCERTYSLHTYPTVRHYRACQQGCYKAVTIKAWSVLGFRLHMNCSELACKNQYFEPDSLYACKLGCEKGKDVLNNAKKVPTSSGKTIPTENEQHSTVTAIILRPVMLLHTYGRGMINKLTYYVQSSTSYYFSTNNGGMVVVNIQREPEIYVSASNSQYNDDAVIQNDEPQKQKQKEIKGHSYTEQHESWIVVRRGHHWLHCVSHKSGVPMWILSTILFLSSFFLLWLCCAASTTSPASKKSEKKAFLIKDFLSASKEKNGQDVPLLKLDDDEEQAGPLPPKTGSAVVNI